MLKEEHRILGVQEFRILLNQRTCLEIGATSHGASVQSPTIKNSVAYE
jgi:hypothetical protein